MEHSQTQHHALVAKLLQLPYPPCQPLSGSEQGSFAHYTITQRLPTILGSVVKDLHRLKSTPEMANNLEWQQQVDAAAAAVSEMAKEVPADADMPPLVLPSASGNRQLQVIVSLVNACVEAWVQHMSSQVYTHSGLVV